jgi:hypothetical protein
MRNFSTATLIFLPEGLIFSKDYEIIRNICDIGSLSHRRTGQSERSTKDSCYRPRCAGKQNFLF